MKRQHPAALIGYTSRKFWLLLFPLARGLAALRFDLARWAEGAEWDILAVAVMLAAAASGWYYTRYHIGESGIKVITGLFIRRRVTVPYQCVCAVTSEETPFLRYFGMVKVYIDTDAATGGRKSADVSLIIPRSERARLFNILSAEFAGQDQEKTASFTHKVSKSALILFSLLFSSALSGVVLLITALSGGTKIIGRQLERDFAAAVNELSDAVAALAGRLIEGISPAGIAVSVIIAAGFLLSFALNIIRHINFTASRRGKCIIISGGIIIKRMYCINGDRINMADMQQNMLMKLFNITSVHVNCTGYGKRRNEIPVFVPICSAGRRDGSLDSAMKMLLPGFSRSESYINPKISYVWRFIRNAALLIIAIPAAGLLSLVYFPHWHSLIAFMTVMLEIPAVWYLLAKACAYCTTGINITEESVCAKYCRGYGFHTVTVPLDRVAQIRLYQSVFQRFTKSCDVIIYTNAEYIGSHRVKNIPIAEVQELVRERF